ncbi:hypothetical protein MPTK1_5g19590 [Marchantia polymorpha subsp. ruderalis]|uniref:Uncharacterized protein n=2 Tax=Marchantia polymorpha TaxID=3197 RepID=A0AAF6BK47_MARPO|nr:hypothetical protein MARPO_0134s0017 [Marchantia polymorpha]BBN12381.1 hypothetical protein Mp_5g19590 [Marchantia polymorpha subsp. ruderalis]|eukprot:PTQ29805.1 hypothetical protein MARPO_0134s0017 [Marchantia polymorpha]
MLLKASRESFVKRTVVVIFCKSSLKTCYAASSERSKFCTRCKTPRWKLTLMQTSYCRTTRSLTCRLFTTTCGTTCR